MTVAVSQRTLAQVVKEVLRLGGYIVPGAEGTSTAGGTTSLTDAANFRTPTAQAGAVTGKYLWMHSGTGIGQQAEIITYGTIGVFTWSPTLTSPAGDTGWILCTTRPQRAIDAIAEVTRRAAYKQAVPYMSEALVTNNLLQGYGSMEEWASGATSAPDGWTLAGAGAAVARIGPDSSNKVQGTYAAQVVAGGGAVATLTRTIPQDLANLVAGQSLTLLGTMNGLAAGDAVVRVTVTATTTAQTNTDRTLTLANNVWQELSDISQAGIATPKPLSNIIVSLRTLAGATNYFDDIVLYGPRLYDYELPYSLIGLEPIITMESGYRTLQFTEELHYGADWTIIKQDSALAISPASARILRFNRPLPSGRHLRIKGYRAPTVQTTQSSNVDPNPSWLAHAATEYLLEGERPTEQTEQRLANVRAWLRDPHNAAEVNTVEGGFVRIEGR